MLMDIENNNIKIKEQFCLSCGKLENITNHHCVPQRMNPKYNVEIPLCKECHKLLHSDDTNHIKMFMDKISWNILNIGDKFEEIREYVNNRLKLGLPKQNINPNITIKNKKRK